MRGGIAFNGMNLPRRILLRTNYILSAADRTPPRVSSRSEYTSRVDQDKVVTLPTFGDIVQSGRLAPHLNANHKNLVPHLRDGSIVAKVGYSCESTNRIYFSSLSSALAAHITGACP
jgi:hypothetical protein